MFLNRTIISIIVPILFGYRRSSLQKEASERRVQRATDHFTITGKRESSCCKKDFFEAKQWTANMERGTAGAGSSVCLLIEGEKIVGTNRKERDVTVKRKYFLDHEKVWKQKREAKR
jgi:hypothetical protein